MTSTSLKLIVAQEKHIKLLQEKLNKLKKEQILRFTATPGWPLFVLRNTSTYSRKNCGKYFDWVNCDVSLRIDDNDVYITCKKGSVITTRSIPVDDFDVFVNDSIYDELSKDSSHYKYWSTYHDSKWSERESNSCNLYSIKNLDKFMQGIKADYLYRPGQNWG